MTNDEVMQLMTDMGLHEGGMDDWVFDNAWVMFANAVASAEREACAKVVENILLAEGADVDDVLLRLAEDIRERGQA